MSSEAATCFVDEAPERTFLRGCLPRGIDAVQTVYDVGVRRLSVLPVEDLDR